MSILLDTNIFVDHFRGHQPAVKFFESLLDRDHVFFSAITETELIAGKECRDFNIKEKILHFLYRWEKIEVSNSIAMLAGDLCRENNISVPDSIIAATALATNAELITKNTKDFRMIKILKMKNPY